MSGNVNTTFANMQSALAAWGDTMPNWIRLLAAACDLTNQRDVGEKLGKSAGYVSRVLRNIYTGNMAEAENLVRATFGGEDVLCPLWGPIPLASCMRNRRRKTPPRNQSHHLHRRTCPTCPNNSDRDQPGHAGEEDI